MKNKLKIKQIGKIVSHKGARPKSGKAKAKPTTIGKADANAVHRTWEDPVVLPTWLYIYPADTPTGLATERSVESVAPPPGQTRGVGIYELKKIVNVSTKGTIFVTAEGMVPTGFSLEASVMKDTVSLE